jgi:hypothetical protein
MEGTGMSTSVSQLTERFSQDGQSDVAWFSAMAMQALLGKTGGSYYDAGGEGTIQEIVEVAVKYGRAIERALASG